MVLIFPLPSHNWAKVPYFETSLKSGSTICLVILLGVEFYGLLSSLGVRVPGCVLRLSGSCARTPWVVNVSELSFYAVEFISTLIGLMGILLNWDRGYSFLLPSFRVVQIGFFLAIFPSIFVWVLFSFGLGGSFDELIAHDELLDKLLLIILQLIVLAFSPGIASCFSSLMFVRFHQGTGKEKMPYTEILKARAIAIHRQRKTKNHRESFLADSNHIMQRFNAPDDNSFLILDQDEEYDFDREARAGSDANQTPAVRTG